MKRPLIGILLGLVLGELVTYLTGAMGLLMPASLFIWSFLNRKRRKEQKPFFLLSLCIAGAISLGSISYLHEDYHVKKTDQIARQLQGETCSFEGKIIRVKITSAGYHTYTIESPLVRQGERKVKIASDITITGKMEGEEVCLPGDEIRAVGNIRPLESASNPGTFDEKRYNLACGIHATGFFDQMECKKRPVISFQRWADAMKRKMMDGYLTNLDPEDSAMLCAMIFGDKSYLTEEEKRLYEENGVAHLLAISGLHVSIVGGLIYRRLRKRGFSYGSSCSIGAAFLLFYGCMTGFGASASRAIVMYLIFLTGEYLGLSYDMISSLALAAIFMLLQQPYHLFEGGFLISFGSIFAIGAVVPFVFQSIESSGKGEKEGALASFIQKVKAALLFSLLIYMVTCPIILSFYYEITPYSIFWNFFLLPCMTPLMLDGIFSGILGLLIGHHRILAAGSIFILRFYQAFLKRVRKLPGAFLTPGCPPWWKILLYYAAFLLFCLLLLKNHKRWAKIVCIGMFLFIMCPAGKPDLRISMLDVGQGDCILFQSQGKSMLLDGGSSSKKDVYRKIIEPSLRYYGISSLDAVLVTHMDEDHLSGIRELLQEKYPVREFFLSDCKENRQTDETALSLQQLAKKQGSRIHFLGKGDSFSFGSMDFSCLHPAAGQSFEEKNDTSLVLLAKCGDFQALFTGDLGMEQEKKLIDRRSHSPITLLKVAHHGSKYSTGEEFLSYFQPRIALISAGKENRYGHPHGELLNRLHEEKSRIYDTISSGAIIIEKEKRNLKILKWKSRSLLTYFTF